MTVGHPAASVIVAVNPHEGDIAEVIDAYAAQRVPFAFELVVVDNGSRAGIARCCEDGARRHPSLVLRRVECRLRGRAAANNAGVRAARADLVVFVADDFIPAPTLVRAHVDFHRYAGGTSVGVGPAFFTASCRTDPFRAWLERSGRLFGVPFATAATGWPRDFFYVGNASLLRRVVERVGGFDETFEHDLVDDFAFGLRLRALGVQTHLLHRAVAWHDHAVTLDERVVAVRRSGAAMRAFELRHGGERPWSALVSVPLGELRHRVERTSVSSPASLRRSEAYAARLDLAFVEGYLGVAHAPAT